MKISSQYGENRRNKYILDIHQFIKLDHINFIIFIKEANLILQKFKVQSYKAKQN